MSQYPPPYPRPNPRLQSVKVLKVTGCKDPLMWYADRVGKYIPDLGDDGSRFIKSQEPAGYTNFVHTGDVMRMNVFVSLKDLGRWPFIVPSPFGPISDPALLPVRTCAGSRNSMGICQALEDCQDAERLQAAQQAKPQTTTTGQSRGASLIEACTNIVLGFFVSLLITAWLLPAYGHDVSLQDNVQITCVFTLASLLRSYLVRRVFNRWLSKPSKPALQANP